jgi:hypothetical protein
MMSLPFDPCHGAQDRSALVAITGQAGISTGLEDFHSVLFQNAAWPGYGRFF